MTVELRDKPLIHSLFAFDAMKPLSIYNDQILEIGEGKCSALLCSHSVELCVEEALLDSAHEGMSRGSPVTQERGAIANGARVAPDQPAPTCAVSGVQCCHVASIGQPALGITRSLVIKTRPRSAPVRAYKASAIQVAPEWLPRGAMSPVGNILRQQLQSSIGPTEKVRRARPASAHCRMSMAHEPSLQPCKAATQRPRSAGLAVVHRPCCVVDDAPPRPQSASYTRVQRPVSARVRPQYYGTSCGRGMAAFIQL
jgi:hypothetical protein